VLQVLAVALFFARTALAEGLSEEDVTGMSRFSYLRVISRSSTLRYVDKTAGVRTVSKEIGARYVREGSLRRCENCQLFGPMSARSHAGQMVSAGPARAPSRRTAQKRDSTLFVDGYLELTLPLTGTSSTGNLSSSVSMRMVPLISPAASFSRKTETSI
jgi:hypothetical protein